MAAVLKCQRQRNNISLSLPNTILSFFPFFQMSSSIVFVRMYGWYYPGFAWDTYSTVNKHTYFCCEEDCAKEAALYGGRCKDCLADAMNQARIQAYAPWRFTTHTCSGEFDYEDGAYVCDDRDDPCCPQHPKQYPSDPKSCADCGSFPECGVFHFYRGNDPLCKSCEEDYYGPPSPDYGRDYVHYPCASCGNYYTKKFIFTPNPGRCNTCLVAEAKAKAEAKEQEPVECPGCGNSIYDGLRANGYCGICWEAKFGIHNDAEDEERQPYPYSYYA